MKRASTAPKPNLIEPPPQNAELWINLTTVTGPSPPVVNQKPKFSIDSILSTIGRNNNGTFNDVFKCQYKPIGFEPAFRDHLSI
jgi:hypothetical protein